MLIFHVHPFSGAAHLSALKRPWWCIQFISAVSGLLALNTERMMACVPCAEMSSSILEIRSESMPYLSMLRWLSDLLYQTSISVPRFVWSSAWHPEADLYWSGFVWLHLRGRKANEVWQSSRVCQSDRLWGNWQGLQIAGTRTLNPYHVLLSSIFRNFTCSLDHRSPVLFLRGHCTEEFCTYPN